MSPNSDIKHFTHSSYALDQMLRSDGKVERFYITGQASGKSAHAMKETIAAWESSWSNASK